MSSRITKILIFLVLDTEVYSNTGGQSSKSAPTGSIAKFTAAGKNTKKKDLAAIAMSYGHVYVAQISHGASPAQVLRAFKEAESFEGPSIIIAYSPCIEHGIKGGLTNSFAQAKLATECGYWPTFRFDPRKEVKERIHSSLILNNQFGINIMITYYLKHVMHNLHKSTQTMQQNFLIRT